MHSGAEIARLQNSDRSITMLAAQRQLYSEAKRLQLIAAALCLGVPVVMSLLQMALAPLWLSSEVAFVLEIALFAAGLFLPRKAQRKIGMGASVQQRFDYELYGFGTYDYPGLDDAVVGAAKRYLGAGKPLSDLRTWYEFDLEPLSSREAVLCCQRENIVWSRKLGAIWLAILVLVGLACLVAVVAMSAVTGFHCSKLVFISTILEWIFVQLYDGVRCMSKMRYLDKVALEFGMKEEEYLRKMQYRIFEYRQSPFKAPDRLFRTLKGRFESIGDDVSAAVRLNGR